MKYNLSYFEYDDNHGDNNNYDNNNNNKGNGKIFPVLN
jgi:hypothetical protein